MSKVKLDPDNSENGIELEEQRQLLNRSIQETSVPIPLVGMNQEIQKLLESNDRSKTAADTMAGYVSTLPKESRVRGPAEKDTNGNFKEGTGVYAFENGKYIINTVDAEKENLNGPMFVPRVTVDKDGKVSPVLGDKGKPLYDILYFKDGKVVGEHIFDPKEGCCIDDKSRFKGQQIESELTREQKGVVSELSTKSELEATPKIINEVEQESASLLNAVDSASTTQTMNREILNQTMPETPNMTFGQRQDDEEKKIKEMNEQQQSLNTGDAGYMEVEAVYDAAQPYQKGDLPIAGQGATAGQPGQVDVDKVTERHVEGVRDSLQNPKTTAFADKSQTPAKGQGLDTAQDRANKVAAKGEFKPIDSANSSPTSVNSFEYRPKTPTRSDSPSLTGRT